MEKPSKDDWDEWKNSRVTQWVKAELRDMAKEYSMQMGEGSTMDVNSLERTALLTAQNVGFVEGITALERIDINE